MLFFNVFTDDYNQGWEKFQSLFCWMLFFNRCTCPSKKHKDCKFQSLFCWMLFFNQLQLQRHINRFLFQSLFCWMLFFNDNSASIPKDRRHKGFNPCFAGCCFSTTFEDYRRLSCRVSILVLLDAVFQLFGNQNQLNRLKSFNPCFAGCCFSTEILTQMRPSL